MTSQTKLFKLLLFWFFVLASPNILMAQNQNVKVKDSLIDLDFEELQKKFYDTRLNDSQKAVLYIRSYLQKAKDLDSVSEKARGYYLISTFFENDYEKRIIYIDSGIKVVKNTEHVLQTGFLYTHKGAITHEKGNYDKALEYYLEGLEHAKRKGVLVYQSLLLLNIGSLKTTLGKYEESKLLYKEALHYQKKIRNKSFNDSTRYLITLSKLINSYILKKEIDSANYFHKQGYKLAQNTDIEGVYTIQKGILQHYLKDYISASKNLNQGIRSFLSSKYAPEYGDYNLIDGYLYLGKSYNNLNQKEIAIDFFKKIDSLVKKSDNLIYVARPAYLELINYYKSINDKNNQLYYIERLLRNDSIFNVQYRLASDKFNKDFDTPNLLIQKENIINELETKNSKSFYIIICTSIAITVVSTTFFISYQKNRKYKKRFNNLIKNENKKPITEKVENQKNSIGIAGNVVEIIIQELNNFEKNNEFLEINLTSSILAKKMNTNSKYLTKVIKYHKNKSYTQYINDHRINYIIQQLKTNHKLRNYTIKAIASEAGFNSTEVFSKYFYKKTGIYPSFFVKSLKTHKN